MHKHYFLLGLCLYLLGGSQGAEQKPNVDDPTYDDWQNSNTMSRQHGEEHTPVEPSGPSDTINIDDNPLQSEMMDDEGSADKQDDDIWSGMGPDDEDGGEEGSADLTHCQKLQEKIKGKKLVGAFVPKCTNEGDYLNKQCHSSTGECWCVDKVGEEISHTRNRYPNLPDCDKFMIVPPEPNMPKLPENKPDPDNGFTDPGFTQPTDNGKPSTEIKNSIDNVNGGNPDVSIDPVDPEAEEEQTNSMASKESDVQKSPTLFGHPGLLAAIIGGAVVGLLCAVLFVMFIVYRMRKKDEGSYALDEPKRSPTHHYQRASTKEFYA